MQGSRQLGLKIVEQTSLVAPLWLLPGFLQCDTQEQTFECFGYMLSVCVQAGNRRQSSVKNGADLIETSALKLRAFDLTLNLRLGYTSERPILHVPFDRIQECIFQLLSSPEKVEGAKLRHIGATNRRTRRCHWPQLEERWCRCPSVANRMRATI